MTRLDFIQAKYCERNIWSRLDYPARALAKQLDVPDQSPDVNHASRRRATLARIRPFGWRRYFRTDPRFSQSAGTCLKGISLDLSKAEQAHNYKKIVPRTAA